jgi:hypothetical protein
MYCPKCGTANNEDTKFCRACGANLMLVPQALSGQLPEAPSRHRSRAERRAHRHGEDSLTSGITQAFIGMAFLIIALGLWFSKQFWGLWMLIPAFALLGKGVAQIVSIKYGPTLTPGGAQAAMPPAEGARELPPRNSQSFVPPPSVTEGTTRHLDATPDPPKSNR